MRNKTLHLIRKSNKKKKNYNTAIQKGTNSKDLWKFFRKIQNNDNDITELSALPPRIKYNGLEVEDTRSILNCLNDHFINIAKIVNKSEFDENSFLAPLAEGQRAIVMALCPSCVRPSVRPCVRP